MRPHPEQPNKQYSRPLAKVRAHALNTTSTISVVRKSYANNQSRRLENRLFSCSFLQVEGAQKVHIEEARLRFDMAIGKMAPVTEDEILLHLREFAGEVRGWLVHALSQFRAAAAVVGG